MNDSANIYHEKQVMELCALHALNNLFQQKDAFSKARLDNICHSLSPDFWINPHKSLLGLGNYDINVIMTALQEKGYETVWFDKRKDPNNINLRNIKGFILNIPSEYKHFGIILYPFRRKHWIALREINGTYYNLDSKFDSPQTIGNETDLINYLREQLDSKNKELFIIVPEEVEKNKSWLQDSTN